MFPFPWSSLSLHPPLPLYIAIAGGVKKEWLWECSLTRLLCALSRAQGFPISRFSCPVISAGGTRASFSWTDPCGEQVISDGGLLLHSKASEIPRCWGKMQIWGHAFHPFSVNFLTIGSRGVLSADQMDGFAWAWWTLSDHSCNCKESLCESNS